VTDFLNSLGGSLVLFNNIFYTGIFILFLLGTTKLLKKIKTLKLPEEKNEIRLSLIHLVKFKAFGFFCAALFAIVIFKLSISDPAAISRDSHRAPTIHKWVMIGLSILGFILFIVAGKSELNMRRSKLNFTKIKNN